MEHALEHPFDPIFVGGSRVKTLRIDPRFLAIAAGAALIGAAAMVGAPRVLEAYQEAKASAAVPPAAVSLKPAELPREWRWERKAVTFDHMYRKKR